MARDEGLPFERGNTFYGLGATPDLSYGVGGKNLEGKEFLAETRPLLSYQPGVSATGRKAKLRVVRNRSAINLLPGRLARNAVGTANAGFAFGTGVDGYCYQASDPIAGVVDEILPAQGVAPGDLFYVVVEGPTTPISAETGSVSIPAGAQIAAAAGTSAVSADAGFVMALNESSTTLAQYIGKVGRAEANLAATITANSTPFPAIVFLPIA